MRAAGRAPGDAGAGRAARVRPALVRPARVRPARYPVHDALSAAVPDHPVLLKHAAGAHMGIVNAAAMRLAGIDATTANPEGGGIVRDARGGPTGVLRETAYALALAAHEADRARRPAEVREADALRQTELATAECLRKGVTSFQDAGASFEELDRYRRLAEDGAASACGSGCSSRSGTSGCGRISPCTPDGSGSGTPG